MYTDTKNLTAVTSNNNMQQSTTIATSGREKSCGRMSKVWKPLLRLLSRKKTTQPRKFHPNNVDLNNTTQYQATKEDSASIHKQQDICTEFFAKQATTAQARLTANQQQQTTTPVISSVYVDKATSPAAITATANDAGTTAIACTGCIYGRNCQHVHSASEQQQLNLLNLLNLSGPELSDTLEYLSTEQGLLCLPDASNSNEHERLLYTLLYQHFDADALPLGTLC